jgi:hypothetical protein
MVEIDRRERLSEALALLGDSAIGCSEAAINAICQSRDRRVIDDEDLADRPNQYAERWQTRNSLECEAPIGLAVF